MGYDKFDFGGRGGPRYSEFRRSGGRGHEIDKLSSGYRGRGYPGCSELGVGGNGEIFPAPNLSFI